MNIHKTLLQTYFSPMASKSILCSIILLVLTCLLLTRETSGYIYAEACSTNGGCLNEFPNRKMLSALKMKPRILREVPGGPNPLHNSCPGCT